jgi:dienelactone hydrolase
MSREDLVEAYVEGGISRRTFIRRLVAGGVSFGAAVSYAHLLAPARAEAATTGYGGDGRDHYEPEIMIEIRAKKLRRVLLTNSIEVHVTGNDNAAFTLVAQAKDKGKLKTIGGQSITFNASTDSVLQLRLNRTGRKLLADRSQSWIQVVATATHQQTQGTYTSSAVATTVLK